MNFGGPAGQIALLHEELVVRRRWIDEERFRHALGFCSLLPGPEAQQLAIYVGWLLHRVRGGLVAGLGFVLPGFVVLTTLAWATMVHGDVPAVAGALWGVRAAVIGVVAVAAGRAGGRLIRERSALAIAAASFLAPLVTSVPFTLVVLAAGIAGALTSSPADTAGPVVSVDTGGASTARVLRALAFGSIAWWAPVLLISSVQGVPDVLRTEAAFFGTTAALTFGGAYAVLAAVTQAAVGRLGWLTSGEVIVGLGLAESTPGPLIMITAFVGYIAAYRDPGALAPALSGLLGASVAAWATFAPSFLWIFLGAPWVERLRGNARLAGAFRYVSAAVAGVLANLAAWLAVQVLFGSVRTGPFLGGSVPIPDPDSLKLDALLLAIGAGVAMGRRIGVLPIVAVAAAVGIALRLT